MKSLKCPKCCKTFNFKSDLIKHLVTHDLNAKVKCKICGIILKHPVALSTHMQRLHTNRKWPSCEICNRAFHDSATLRKHTEVVHSTSERPRLPCGFPNCEKTFLDKRCVSRHIKTDHVENPVRFSCILCGKEFKNRGDLGHHILTHTTEKPFKCANCGRSFSEKQNLKRHEKVHLERSTRVMSKCHICTHCQTFLTRNGLQGHIRIVHENRKDYPCTFCDKRFSCSTNLKGHVNRAHPSNTEKVHSCDKCEYKSHSKVNLDYHVTRAGKLMNFPSSARNTPQCPDTWMLFLC
ncbi:gastrula zinc finger protein XlCGF7.1 isoform X2 [Folsomia candida]|uniref:gastrula zinc finger protein XlCGF7.1 isoform X2 n=1 Tax=Folsomia candida TaxID=158441 RepID=UPI0016052F51|nr:gastrula zinc finger protein XlCGF7.1 isoform X2 [Folsomia candida]